MSPLVCIILVNYKTVNDTIECINSLRKIDYDNFKVIVVENGSNDGSYEKLKEVCKDELLIESFENLGFAGGNNIGIERALNAGAEYILLLNNDTVVDNQFLSKLVEAFEYSLDVGIVGCKINYYDNRNVVNYAGGEINWNKFTTYFYRSDEIDDKDESIKEISFVSGCAMMISKKVIEKIGLLDHTYFMYYEDTDYCAMAAENGFKLLYQPESVIYHKISSSSGGDLSPFVLYWSTKNRYKFRVKFKHKVSKLNLIKFDIFNFLTRIMRIGIYYFKREPQKSKAIVKGYIHGLKGVK